MFELEPTGKIEILEAAEIQLVLPLINDAEVI